MSDNMNKYTRKYTYNLMIERYIRFCIINVYIYQTTKTHNNNTILSAGGGEKGAGGGRENG